MYGISEKVIALAEFVAHTLGEAECLVEVLELVAQVLFSIINQDEYLVGELDSHLRLTHWGEHLLEECFVHSSIVLLVSQRLEYFLTYARDN